MRLLTWHGTIIRLETATGRITHTRLVPVRDLAVDFILALPPEGLTAPLAGPNEITLVPGTAPGTAHLQRRGLFLSVQGAPYPLFTAAQPGEAETLHLVADDRAALLRDLLSHGWIHSADGAAIGAEEMALGPGPHVVAGSHKLGLHDVTPGGTPDTLIVPGGTLSRVAGSTVQAREIALRRQDGAAIPEVTTEADFASRAAARLRVPAPPELAIPPILGSLADRDFLYRRGSAGLPPARGRLHLHSQVVRGRDKYVLLDRGVAGMVLDEGGVLTGAEDAANLGGALPRHFGREGDRYFIAQAALDGAARLVGPHAVFYGGSCEDDDGWLIGAMVPLTILAPYLPPGTALLLPARLSGKAVGTFDPVAMLDAFGFGEMPRSHVPGQICRAEVLFWPDRCPIGRMPASALRAARERVIARRPPGGGRRTRIYLRRAASRSVANAHVVESILTKNGFTPVLLEELSANEQIDLFRGAEMVVGAHGAGLANLLFCPPGTMVLELSPDCRYRPVVNEMSAKLGLTHAVLPCATDDGGPDGRLIVPAPRLTALLGLLLSRQAA